MSKRNDILSQFTNSIANKKGRVVTEDKPINNIELVKNTRNVKTENEQEKKTTSVKSKPVKKTQNKQSTQTTQTAQTIQAKQTAKEKKSKSSKAIYKRITICLTNQDLEKIDTIRAEMVKQSGAYLNRSELMKVALRSINPKDNNLNTIIDEVKSLDMRRK